MKKGLILFFIVFCSTFQVNTSNTNEENIFFEKKIFAFINEKTNDKYKQLELL
jgi:hypothetical protein